MAHQEFKISGVSVLFPCKPYPSQFSMMDKILKGIERRQNCLLESPTGSGKSLALLCSSLAWQAAEKAKRDLEDAKEFEKAECMCTCHTETPVAKEPEPSTDGEDKQASKPSDAGTEQPHKSGWPSFDFQMKDNDEDDFKMDDKKMNISNKKSPRGHLSIEYEGEKTSETKKPSCTQCECDSGVTDGKTRTKVPKIFFGTRTHRQVAQIVKELRKTAYSDTKMTILGSREHTCIHPSVSKMKNKNDGCKELLNDQGGCRFKDGTPRLTSQRVIKDLGLNHAWDLEDLVGLGKAKKACPYFLSRGLKDDSDIIICPYNYLVDPVVREAMMINIKGHIIILDEAHNIEDSAREAASQSIGQDVIWKGIQDIDGLMEQGINFADHSKLRSMLNNLDRFIEDNKGKLDQKDFNKSYRIWSGFYIVAQLEDLGLGPKFYPDLKKALSTINAELEERKEEAAQAGLNQDLVQMKPATLNLLEQIFQVLEYLYRADLKYVDDYRASLVQSVQYVPRSEEGQWLSARNRYGGRNMVQTELYTLNFWCMNPGVAFSDFAETRSIILTSGTLSPLTSFESELGLEFKIQLEANHVIKDSQVWVGTLGQGPGGGNLQAVFRNLETFTFQDELGALVLKVCETVPHGVLCFLPSYKVLEKLISRWENIGLLQKIAKRKRIISEPRGSDKMDFEEQMKLFYDAVNFDSSEYADDDFDSVDGAVFFAVCRGKVSEGLDFADNFARAVITVGIPYPNFKDVQVELKRKYNDQHKVSRGLLSGGDWYEIQAFRALNQALGRCIRHRQDWGALIIVDDRFVKSAAKYCKGLSKWVRNKTQTFHNFPCALDSLKMFTESQVENQKNMSSMETSSMASPSPRKPLFDINTPVAPVSNFPIFNVFQTPVRGGKHNSSATKGSTNNKPDKNSTGSSTSASITPSKPQNKSTFNSPSVLPKPDTKNSSIAQTAHSNPENQSTSISTITPSKPTNNGTVGPTTPSAKLSEKIKMSETTPKPKFVYRPTTQNSLSVSAASSPDLVTSSDMSKPATTTVGQRGEEADTPPCGSTVIQRPLHGKIIQGGDTSVQTSKPVTGASNALTSNQDLASKEPNPACPPVQLRIITERAQPGTRFQVFEIPAHLHSVFGGNLNLPVSTMERLVYLVDPPTGPGSNPTARLVRMSDEEKEEMIREQTTVQTTAQTTAVAGQSALGQSNNMEKGSESVQKLPASSTHYKDKQKDVVGVQPSNVVFAQKQIKLAPKQAALGQAMNLPPGTILAPVQLVRAPHPANSGLKFVPIQQRPGAPPLLLAAPALRTPQPAMFTTPNLLNFKQVEGLLQKVTAGSTNSHSSHNSRDEVIIVEADSSESVTKPSTSSTDKSKVCSVRKTPAKESQHEQKQSAKPDATPFPVHLVQNVSLNPTKAAVHQSPTVCSSISPVLFSPSQSPTTPSPKSALLKPESINTSTGNRRPMFKQQQSTPKSVSKSLKQQTLNKTISSSTTKSKPEVSHSDSKAKPGNVRIAPPKISAPTMKDEAPTQVEAPEEVEEDAIQTKRRTKGRKRKSGGAAAAKTPLKRIKDEADSTTSTQKEKAPSSTPVFRCVKCEQKLVGCKSLSDVQEQRTTPPFIREVLADSAKRAGCFFISTNASKCGLVARTDSAHGTNTKYVEQEEICVQFVCCSQCIKTDSEHARVVGAQVQLAAGSGARFSKGQMWLFYGAVTREDKH